MESTDRGQPSPNPSVDTARLQHGAPSSHSLDLRTAHLVLWSLPWTRSGRLDLARRRARARVWRQRAKKRAAAKFAVHSYRRSRCRHGGRLWAGHVHAEPSCDQLMYLHMSWAAVAVLHMSRGHRPEVPSSLGPLLAGRLEPAQAEGVPQRPRSELHKLLQWVLVLAGSAGPCPLAHTTLPGWAPAQPSWRVLSALLLRQLSLIRAGHMCTTGFPSRLLRCPCQQA